jgi:hypothetical protein
LPAHPSAAISIGGHEELFYNSQFPAGFRIFLVGHLPIAIKVPLAQDIRRAASGIALRDDIVIVCVQPVEHSPEPVGLDLVDTELIIPIAVDVLERIGLPGRLAGGEEYCQEASGEWSDRFFWGFTLHHAGHFEQRGAPEQEKFPLGLKTLPKAIFPSDALLN